MLVTEFKSQPILQGEALTRSNIERTVRDKNVELTARPGLPDVSVSWPVLGRPDIDRDIESFVEYIIETFERDTAGAFSEDEDGLRRCSLTCSYKVSWPSRTAVSVTFELWMDTGGEHPGTDVITMNYSLLSGQRLGLVDLFEDEQKALGLMSAYSRRELPRRIGGGLAGRMIREGTQPNPDNFASLTLTKEGVRVNFQPYQVADWTMGVQKVEIPLEELLPARPLLSVWGR